MAKLNGCAVQMWILSPSCGHFFVWRQVRLSSPCFLLVSTGLHAFVVFLRHVGLTLGRTRSTWTYVRNTRRFVCVPRAPPSKTAFDTFNTNLHRRVRCASLGQITKSSQRQRNCVLTGAQAHRKDENCRRMEKQSRTCAWPHINETNGGPTTIAGTLASILGLLEKSDMLFLGTTRKWWLARNLGLSLLLVTWESPSTFDCGATVRLRSSWWTRCRESSVPRVGHVYGKHVDRSTVMYLRNI